jgi:hypothetical protein
MSRTTLSAEVFDGAATGAGRERLKRNQTRSNFA